MIQMDLNPIEVNQADFVAALRETIDRPYSGVATGAEFNCTGVILYALKRVGLWSEDQDINVSSVAAGRPRARVFRDLLIRNCDLVQPGSLRPGDILLLRWHDVDPRRREPHHVAAWTEAAPTPFGSMIQALDSKSGGPGQVFEAHLDALDWIRIDEAWRIRNLRGDL